MFLYEKMPNYCEFVTIICYHSPVPHSSKKPPPPQLGRGGFGGAGVGYRAMNSLSSDCMLHIVPSDMVIV